MKSVLETIFVGVLDNPMNYIIIEKDGVKALYKKGRTFQSRPLIFDEDGNMYEIEQVGQSRIMDYSTYLTYTQVKIRGEWTIVDKSHILGKTSDTEIDLPHMSQILRGYVSFSKYDQKNRRVGKLNRKGLAHYQN